MYRPRVLSLPENSRRPGGAQWYDPRPGRWRGFVHQLVHELVHTERTFAVISSEW